MSRKNDYPTFSRSNFNLIVGILSDAGFFVNLNHMKSGKIFVAEVNGVNDPLMAVWAHLHQFKPVVEITRTENKQVVVIEVR